MKKIVIVLVALLFAYILWIFWGTIFQRIGPADVFTPGEIKPIEIPADSFPREGKG